MVVVIPLVSSFLRKMSLSSSTDVVFIVTGILQLIVMCLAKDIFLFAYNLIYIRTQEIAFWVECLPHKHGDLNSEAEHALKSR